MISEYKWILAEYCLLDFAIFMTWSKCVEIISLGTVESAMWKQANRSKSTQKLSSDNPWNYPQIYDVTIFTIKIMHGKFYYLYSGGILQSLSNIWQCFSFPLDKAIANYKKFNSNNVFLRAHQDGARKVLPDGWIGCAILQVAQNAILGFQLLAYFCNPLINWKRLLICVVFFYFISIA